jgi:D-serine dehydratase
MTRGGQTTSAAELAATELDSRYKGMPLGVTTTLGEIAKQGWNVLRGHLALPVTTLQAVALEHNIRTMAAYADRYGASLAPHGKTTMSPQLFWRQLEAGAWAITAATPSQVAIMRAHGITRIVLANELVEPAALRWIAHELADPDFEFYCLVDSPETVAMMSAVLDTVPGHGQVNVLVEVGVAGGRTGSRSLAEVLDTAVAVGQAPRLRLAGVEAYEGMAGREGTPSELAAVDALLDRVHDAVTSLAARGDFADTDPIVSAGGSAYFDRVVARLSDWSGSPVTPNLVLRSGCYVSHDAGRYHRVSPLDGRRGPYEELQLHDALQTWAVVLSRPEPTLAILGVGKRDVPFDVDLPVPQTAHRTGGATIEIAGRAVITKLMDQHAFVTVDEDLDIHPGDVVSLGLSHPCGAFDKSRLVPLINESGDVVDAILTFF